MRFSLPIRLAAALAALAFAASAFAQADARVIVKFKADSPLLRPQALSAETRHASQAEALGKRVGLTMRAGAGVAERTQVVFASGVASEQLAERLSRESDIEYAVVDRRRYRAALPNDPYYSAGPAVDLVAQTGGPVAGQWYLRAPDATFKSAINAAAAWDVTIGGPSVVVAVLDTGVRFDHPELLGGNVLPGYDMISDAAISNKNGQTRGPVAADPGDWITAADQTSNPGAFGPCPVDNSSWHGTQTAGLVGAFTDNGSGIAGVGRNVRILPVRVLGKCGGFDSDIIAGMRWAVGLSVPGVPANPNPARVINMSLGGEGACTQNYVDAVAAINAAGGVVVASAGNSAGHPVSSPANCPGVIGVVALRHAGNKVGFSDMGPEIAISAPGGNCVNIGLTDPCLYPIMTISNSGTTTPVANTAGGSIYTDSFNASLGTSFSAPLVAGTAALMFSVQPALTPSEVRAALQATARSFPTSGAEDANTPFIPICPAPIANKDQDQCYCTTTTCGAGMLDAGAAALAANVQARIGVSPAPPVAGQAITLSAAPSLVTSGRSIAAYRWTLVNGGGIATGFAGATDGPTATITASAAGSFTASLRVTDNAGLQSTATQVVKVSAAPPAGGGGGGGALGGGWLMALAAAVALSSPRRGGRKGGSRGRAPRP